MAVGEASIRRDFTVGFLSLSSDTSIEKFIAKIDDALRGQKCVFSKLTITDLQSVAPRNHDFDAVVLLHSILHGRNSITDVAGAKYSKLLPQLKAKYGPHRIGVIVHSMMSLNTDTKTALMMVFKKSQPTTFKCSNCVIQCGKPVEMAEDDFTQLVDFLAHAPQYKLPTCDESLNKSSYPPTGEVQNRDSANASRSDAYTGQGASSSVTQETKPYSATSSPPDLQTAVKPALIVALIILPDDRNHVAINGSVNTTLQEGTIFATKQMQDLEYNWHMFGAILIDVGPPEKIRNLKGCLDDMVGRCRKKLREPQNVAILMKKMDHSPDDKVQELMHLLQTRIFIYEDVSGNSTVFDDATAHSLRDWVQRCYSRFVRAHANPPTGNVFIQSLRKGIKSVCDSS